MKKFIIITSVVLFFNSCASIIANTVGMKQEDKAYIIRPENLGENRAVAVFYSYDFLKEKEDKRAETNMREPNYKHIPEFGYISIRIQGWSAGTANTKDWLFIVQDKNKNEIYRSYGLNSRPRASANNLGTHYNTTYWNLHNIYLTSNFEFPLYLRVVTATNEAIDITIIKK
jgi:hypothetical protein